MPAGVRGFVKERLTMAREARNMRQRELAALVNRTGASVSKWEAGSQAPEPSVISDLCQALNVYPSWFFKPIGVQENTVFFRSLMTELEASRNRARARLGFVEAIEQVLARYIDLPDADVPDVIGNFDFRDLRSDDIEGIAGELRNYWELDSGPISDLMLLIENAGVVVGEDTIGSVKLDGVSWWSGHSKRPYILLSKDKRSGSRRRFDAAHEFAHVVLHRNVTQDQLTDDFDLVESQAMQLAGALLLPAQEFKSAVYSISLDGLLRLKQDWGVSVGAMIKRLANLGELSPHNERRLWQYYSSRHWRSREPNEDLVPIEVPENLKASVEMVTSSDIGRQELLKEIGLSAEDVTILCGLDGDFFEIDRTARRSKPILRQSSTLFSEEQEENIIPFRRGGR